MHGWSSWVEARSGAGQPLEAIKAQTRNPSIEALCGDLSSQREARRVASEFIERHDRLHVLINNAGALFALRRESADGIEMTMALNHLGHFLLTALLLDTLKSSAPARIVNVSSAAHDDVREFDFTTLQPAGHGQSRHAYGRSEVASLLYSLTMPWKHPGFVRYAQSKLANLLSTFELARRLEGTGVTVNALHPGLVATGLSAGNGSFGWFLRLWSKVLAISPEEGARTMVHLATSPDAQGVSGKYFVKEKPMTSSLASRDEAAVQRLWELSKQLTGLALGP